MKWVHDRDGIWQLFSSSGLEAGEAIHRDDLDPVPEVLGLLIQPSLEDLL